LSFCIAFRNREQDADPTHPIGLLCARRQRPSSRSAADKRDEIASSHGLPSKTGSYPTMLIVHGASRQIRMSDVRFGSKADMTQSNSDVRFTPKSRHH
jgi:hypothetical protein